MLRTGMGKFNPAPLPTATGLSTSSKRLSKAIKMVKSPKTGAYTYVESIMSPELVNNWLSK